MWERAKRTAGWLGTIAFGLGIVGGVFTALGGMITGTSEPLERVEVRRIEFEFSPPEERLESKRAEKPKRNETALPTPDWTPHTGSCIDCESGLVALRVVDRSFDGGRRDLHLGVSQGIDADPQPLVRIPPEYPPNGRGDGWVLVEFDISPAGAVSHARVVDAAPRGMFEKSALRAIARWRYRPAVVEGRAVERRGVRVWLRFELERA